MEDRSRAAVPARRLMLKISRSWMEAWGKWRVSMAWSVTCAKIEKIAGIKCVYMFIVSLWRKVQEWKQWCEE
jgi:hypothetical protein